MVLQPKLLRVWRICAPSCAYMIHFCLGCYVCMFFLSFQHLFSAFIFSFTLINPVWISKRVDTLLTCSYSFLRFSFSVIMLLFLKTGPVLSLMCPGTKFGHLPLWNERIWSCLFPALNTDEITYQSLHLFTTNDFYVFIHLHLSKLSFTVQAIAYSNQSI